VFITTTNPGPRTACQAIRRLPGIVRADALFGTPDVVAIVTGDDLASMDGVIDRIVELPEVVGSMCAVQRPARRALVTGTFVPRKGLQMSTSGAPDQIRVARNRRSPATKEDRWQWRPATG
jgi:hypothetical protein